DDTPPLRQSRSHIRRPPDISAMPRQDRLPIIAILAMPNGAASVIYGMYDLFRSAGRDWPVMLGGPSGDSVIEPFIVSRTAGPLSVMNDVVVTAHAGLSEAPLPDIICIPDLALYPDSRPEACEPEIEWLRRCYAQGSTIATACTGALLLAETGLLDGGEATTHWAYCDALARRHPTVTMRPKNVLVMSGVDQRLVMGGGGSSWLDLALFLIARVAGIECAMQTARIYLIDWHQGGQQPYARLARSRQSGDAVIAQCQVWIAQNYETPSPVAGMLQISGLAERTFARRFHSATGLSPMEYVHTLRLEEAKQQLEIGEEVVEAIANAVGYEDAGFFSRLFKRKVGLSPSQYRRRFGGMRRMLQASA
ncbi:MAG TPA: helix-turn-helix domain-containing protein, partial [Pseudoxanthomonas sp.]